jgi:beta-lactam-binding protein with PASTA domain
MRRGCFDNLLFGLLLAVAFGASSYFWFNFFIRGKSIPTPNLIGQPIPEARALCSDLGLLLIVDSNLDRNADKIPAGAVVYQNRTPGATSFVKRGTRIHVGRSLGPLVNRVPDLAGQTGRTALLRLSQQALGLGNLSYVDSIGAEGVLAEDPPVDTVVPAQTAVSLLVGVPATPRQYVMPDLIDKPLQAVRPALERRGLSVGNVKFEAYPGISDGIIIRQFPLRGAPVSARDAITLVVSKQQQTGFSDQLSTVQPPQKQP